VHLLGYRNPYILQKVKKQLDGLVFSPRRFTNRISVDFAQKLTRLTPDPLNKVLFAPGGTLATSIALKLVRIATGKHKVISMWDSFHGAGMDSLSVGGESLFRKNLGPLMTGVFHVPPPSAYRGFLTGEEGNDEKYADYIEYVIQKEGDIGAVIAETIRDSVVEIPSVSYWQKVRAICDKYNVLLILDEIPIGLGKTGKMFAFEHFGIQPDILTLGKGLGGGIIPIASVIVNENLDVGQTTALGHYTHEKSPLGAAAGLAVLEFLEKENILAKVGEDEKFLKEELHMLKDKFELIGDIRGRGLLWGIELVKNRNTKEKAVDKAEKIMYYCMENGLSFKVSSGNVLMLTPPLTITRDELKHAVEILENAFKSIK
jgi:4-aminobutyrate aminotransferase